MVSVNRAAPDVGPGPILTGAQPPDSIVIANNKGSEKRFLTKAKDMQDITDLNQGDLEIANLLFQEAVDLAAIETICRLANEIWYEYYGPIIGIDQVKYMLARFQSVQAIRHQIDTGYQYFLLSQGAEPIAYFALVADQPRRTLHLSKLYVRAAARRNGVGGKIIAFIEAYCRRHGMEQIWLTVNRHNHAAIDFYLNNKFINAGSLLQDIGDGFVMDDFKMIKNIAGCGFESIV
ncbi:MAG: GNAT family N-acetyltransferase [Methylomonas sp.]|nr:GNAT family N-acetyltransferase [Methylomonas sp.]